MKDTENQALHEAEAVTTDGEPEKKKHKRKPAESTTLLDETTTNGNVSRLHYTEAQVGVLTSMKRGSSGISHEQATETSYQGIVDEQDRIPFQRSRDKGHLERYYVTPSVPKAVIAKEILEILEPKFRLGQTSASLDTFLLETAKAADEEWKWRALFAERQSKLISAENEKLALMNSKRGSAENKSKLTQMNRVLLGRINTLENCSQREKLMQVNRMLAERIKTLEKDSKRMFLLHDREVTRLKRELESAKSSPTHNESSTAARATSKKRLSEEPTTTKRPAKKQVIVQKKTSQVEAAPKQQLPPQLVAPTYPHPYWDWSTGSPVLQHWPTHPYAYRTDQTR